MRLILNGGTYDKLEQNSMRLFARLLDGGECLLIPLAQKEEYQPEYVDWFKNEAKSFGISNVSVVTSAEELTRKRLKTARGIFIGGGNTYRLLKALKDCKAFKNIEEFFEREDTILMGESAGALIFGRSIDTVLDDGLKITAICDKNMVNQSPEGFDSVNGYSLLVHYKKVQKENPLTAKRVKRLITEGYKLICLPEEASVYIENDSIIAVGTKPIEVFNGLVKKTYKNGDKLDL